MNADVLQVRGREHRRMQKIVLVLIFTSMAMVLPGRGQEILSARTPNAAERIAAMRAITTNITVQLQDPVQPLLGIRLLQVTTNSVVVESLKSGKRGIVAVSKEFETVKGIIKLTRVDATQGTAMFRLLKGMHSAGGAAIGRGSVVSNRESSAAAPPAQDVEPPPSHDIGKRENMKNKTMEITGVAVALLVAAQVAAGIDYKKNTISGGGVSNTSTFSSYSSSVTINGSNVTTVTAGAPTFTSGFSDFDWPESGFGRQTLDQRIRDAEQRLNKLYFIRDVCRKLEDEIRISFEKKDIREVLGQVSEILGTQLPCEIPEGNFLVEKSDVSGMPADQFLDSIARVCGLTLKYERNKLVFQKPEAK